MTEDRTCQDDIMSSLATWEERHPIAQGFKQPAGSETRMKHQATPGRTQRTVTPMVPPTYLTATTQSESGFTQCLNNQHLCQPEAGPLDPAVTHVFARSYRRWYGRRNEGRGPGTSTSLSDRDTFRELSSGDFVV